MLNEKESFDKPETKILSFDEFIKEYKPKRNSLNPDAAFDGHMFETFGEEENYVAHYDKNYVWTVIEENDRTMIIPGYHFVNRLGYIITEKPWPSEIDIAVEGDDT